MATKPNDKPSPQRSAIDGLTGKIPKAIDRAAPPNKGLGWRGDTGRRKKAFNSFAVSLRSKTGRKTTQHRKAKNLAKQVTGRLRWRDPSDFLLKIAATFDSVSEEEAPQIADRAFSVLLGVLLLGPERAQTAARDLDRQIKELSAAHKSAAGSRTPLELELIDASGHLKLMRNKHPTQWAPEDLAGYLAALHTMAIAIRDGDGEAPAEGDLATATAAAYQQVMHIAWEEQTPLLKSEALDVASFEARLGEQARELELAREDSQVDTGTEPETP